MQIVSIGEGRGGRRTVLLKEIRQERGLSQMDLSTKSKVSIQTIRNLEQGRHRVAPKYGTLAKLAVVLDVDPADIDDFTPAISAFEAENGIRLDEDFRTAIAATIRAEVKKQMAEIVSQQADVLRVTSQQSDEQTTT